MIRYIQKQPIQIPNHNKPVVAPKSAAKEIVSNFQKMFDEVNQTQLTADKKVSEMVSGKNKDIPNTMIAMEKADVAFKLLMQIRNKVISAYETIMRTQV